MKPDNKGKQQIGHGHDLLPAELASGVIQILCEDGVVRYIPFEEGITLAEADGLLDFDLGHTYEPAVNSQLNAQGAVANQNQFDALVDFDYNLGAGRLATMLHHGFDKAPEHIPAWCYMEDEYGIEVENDGLKKRRAAEVALFNTPIAIATPISD